MASLYLSCPYVEDKRKLQPLGISLVESKQEDHLCGSMADIAKCIELVLPRFCAHAATWSSLMLQRTLKARKRGRALPAMQTCEFKGPTVLASHRVAQKDQVKRQHLIILGSQDGQIIDAVLM